MFKATQTETGWTVRTEISGVPVGWQTMEAAKLSGKTEGMTLPEATMLAANLNLWYYSQSTEQHRAKNRKKTA